MRSLLVRFLLLVVILGLVTSVGAGGFIWLKLSALKTKLTTNLERELHADVTIGALVLNPWDGNLLAKNITLVNQKTEHERWQRAEIGSAEADFQYSDFLKSELPLAVHISNWKLYLSMDSDANPHSTASISTVAPSPTPSPSIAAPLAAVKPSDDTVSTAIRITQISASDGRLEWTVSEYKTAVFMGVSLQAKEDSDHRWTSPFQAETLTLDSFKAFGVSCVVLFDQNQLHINDIHASCQPGLITGSANIRMGEKAGVETNLKVAGLPLAPLLSASWQGKVSGFITGQVKIAATSDHCTAEGEVNVEQGICNLFPALSTIAKLVGTADFGSLTLDHAETKFLYTDDAILLTDLDLRKDQVARIAGDLKVTKEEQLEGHLQLGIPALIAARWPALQQEVFPVEREGHDWTPVVVSGTALHPGEDLSPRLVKFGEEQGKSLFNQGTEKAEKWLNGWLGK